MSSLASIDAILDLVADVKEIDTVISSDPVDGRVTIQLMCGQEQHSTWMVTEKDFMELHRILDSTLVFQHV